MYSIRKGAYNESQEDIYMLPKMRKLRARAVNVTIKHVFLCVTVKN